MRLFSSGSASSIFAFFASRIALIRLVAIGLALGGAVAYLMPSFAFKNMAAKSVEEDVAIDSYLKKDSAEPEFDIRHLTLNKNETFYGMLRNEGVISSDILNLVRETKKYIDLGRLRRGTTFRAIFDTSSPAVLQKLEIDMSSLKLAVVTRVADRWETVVLEREIERRPVVFQGLVTSSLWESGVKAGVDFAVLQALTEVFAWQIDFSREVRPNDRWRVVMERLYVENKPFGWGKILAAEYVNKQEVYSAIWYESPEGKKGHYFPDGSSLKKMFLRSPIRFARISSAFNPRRFHPILKRKVPHNGVDYAAPTGTPIRAVGDGRIKSVGYLGASGKHITIRHNSTYKTSYSHLSRYAKGLKRGKLVSQGDIIGYVGATGRATGPHLHFSFYENGRFVDPLGKKFPSADPVAKKYKKAFDSMKIGALAKLPAWDRSELYPGENSQIAADSIKESGTTASR